MTGTILKEVKVIRPTIGVSAEKKLRVAAYCRVSTDSADQINSFMTQVKYYNDYIRISESMILVDIYADEGITGTSVKKRDEFQRMLKDSKNGKIDRIFVKSVSRFARNSLECIENIRLLKSYGTTVLFENDAIDTEKMNSEMILYIKSAFAQSEALAGSKRVSTAFRMKMETGNFITCTAPFGYRLENNMLILIPEEADIVKRIFQEFSAGKGCGKIASDFNNDPEMVNKPWTKEGVRYMLSNEKYIGDSLLQKTYTPAVLPLRNIRNNGEIDQYYVQNSHDAIISREVFEGAQRLLQKKKDKLITRCPPKKYGFSNHIFCGACGWCYKRHMQKGIAYWVCSQNGTAGKRCGTHNLTEESIIRTFMAMYNRLRQNEKEIVDDTLSQLTFLKSKVTSKNSDISEIDGELVALGEQNSMYIRLREKDIMDDISYMEQTAELQKRIAELRSRRLKILNEDDDECCIETLRKLKQQLSDLPAALFLYDHSIFKSLIRSVKVGADDVLTFEFICGLKLRECVKWN